MTSSRPIVVGVDASCWYNRRGFGRYTRELLRGLIGLDAGQRYVLFADRETADHGGGLPSAPHVEHVVVDTTQAAARAAAADGARALPDLWRMRRAVARRRDLHVFLFPAAYTYFPIATRARVIVTKHDMTDRRFPHLLFPSRRSHLMWTLKIRLAMRRADIVATVSETSRRDIVEAFRLPAERVRVVPDAVDAHFRPIPDSAGRRAALARYGIPDGPYLLYVGGISPHKNLETLLEAYARLRQSGHDRGARLVLLGDYQGDVFLSSYGSVRARLEALGVGDRVVFTGYVPDADLPACYSAARALVLPSLWEGFGLPALEAMACGTAVLVSRAGALPEVVGDAGLYFAPRDAAELAERLAEVLGDDARRAALAAGGLTRAAAFRWDASARAAAALIDETARR